LLHDSTSLVLPRENPTTLFPLNPDSTVLVKPEVKSEQPCPDSDPEDSSGEYENPAGEPENPKTHLRITDDPETSDTEDPVPSDPEPSDTKDTVPLDPENAEDPEDPEALDISCEPEDPSVPEDPSDPEGPVDPKCC
jgi:hypothetical protein